MIAPIFKFIKTNRTFDLSLHYIFIFKKFFLLIRGKTGFFTILISLPHLPYFFVPDLGELLVFFTFPSIVIAFLSLTSYSLNFGWFLRYNLIGYNFIFKNSFKRRLLRLTLGYSRHRFIVSFPKAVYIGGRKRRLFLMCFDLYYLFAISKYFLNVRNVLPYKLRGLVCENSKFNVLKQGKKVKYR
jgi:hypothetical protein